jgi:magnesium-transporting ATPase (P-type)
MNHELVICHILALKNWDRIPEDSIFISDHNLKVNNSQETGESIAVKVDENIHSF